MKNTTEGTSPITLHVNKLASPTHRALWTQKHSTHRRDALIIKDHAAGLALYVRPAPLTLEKKMATQKNDIRIFKSASWTQFMLNWALLHVDLGTGDGHLIRYLAFVSVRTSVCREILTYVGTGMSVGFH